MISLHEHKAYVKKREDAARESENFFYLKSNRIIKETFRQCCENIVRHCKGELNRKSTIIRLLPAMRTILELSRDNGLSRNDIDLILQKEELPYQNLMFACNFVVHGGLENSYKRPPFVECTEIEWEEFVESLKYYDDTFQISIPKSPVHVFLAIIALLMKIKGSDWTFKYARKSGLNLGD